MIDEEYKYIAFCEYDDEEHLFKGNNVEGLMNEIDTWYEETQGYTPYESQHIDDTICISDFKFLIYRR